MKKKLNLKLTACLVSLFIGLIVMIVWGKYKFGLAFGVIILACSMFLFAIYKVEAIDKTMVDINEQLDEIDGESEEGIFQLREMSILISKLKKQRRSTLILFNITGVLLGLLGIIAMI